MNSKEKKLQSQIIKYLQSKGAYVVKVVVASHSTLDLIVCYKGKFIAIEVKGDSKVSQLQLYNITQIQKAGGIAIVATELSQVVELLQVIDLLENKE